MKKRLILYISLCCITLNTFAQDFSTKSGKSLFNVKLKSGKIGEDTANVPTPTEGSKYYKIKINVPNGNSTFALSAREYLDGQIIRDEFETINILYNLKEKQSIIFEIIPDLSNIHFLRLFFYFPSFDSYRTRLADEDKYWGYHIYDYSNIEYNKEIPIMIFFEDNIQKKTNMNLINKLLVENKIVVNEEKQKQLLSNLHRYYLVTYKLTKQKK